MPSSLATPTVTSSAASSAASSSSRVTGESQADLAFRSALSSEAEFVLLSARTQLQGARLRRWEKLLASSQPALDWTLVLQLATSHRVLGLLGRHLSARSWSGVTSEVKQQLQSYLVYATIHSNALKHELARVSHRLESAGIRVVSFKGHTLGLAAYGNAVVRPSADLDLLVGRADALRARRLLATQGYSLEVTLHAQQEEQILRQDSVFNLSRPAEPSLQTVLSQGYATELHWAITSPCLPFDLDYSTVAPRLGWLELPGVASDAFDASGGASGEASGEASGGKELFRVRSLAPEDLFLILCVHGAKHLWERLIWICDLAELIEKTPAFDWAILLSAARERGVQRMTALGLCLMRGVMGTALPSEVESWLSTQPEALRLASHLRRQLLVSDVSNEGQLQGHTLSADAMLMQTIDAPQNRLGFLWHLATVPTLNERATLNLPAKLDFLWCVVRPARALQKRWRSRKTKNPEA